MKRFGLICLLLISASLSSFAQAGGRFTDHSRPPAKGSAVRQAILDALRSQEQVAFKVHYLRVSRGWAWIDVTPFDGRRRPAAERY